MVYKPNQYPIAKMVNPQIGLNALGGMGGPQQPYKGLKMASPISGTPDNQQPFRPAPETVQPPSLHQPPNAFADPRQPPSITLPTWEETYKPYDPTTDPLIGAAVQAGQQQLDAGLMALQQTFGEQRKELEGRMFQGDLAGSGIQEAIYGKQGRAEGQQTGQLAAEISAQTMLNQVDIMREGTDRAITLAQNEIDNAFKQGQISLEEYNAYTNNLQAETDRLRAIEDQKRTAILEGQAFAPEGGEDFARHMEETHGWLYSDLAGDKGFTAEAPPTPADEVPTGTGMSFEDLKGSIAPTGLGIFGGIVRNDGSNLPLIITTVGGSRFRWDEATRMYYKI